MPPKTKTPPSSTKQLKKYESNKIELDGVKTNIKVHREPTLKTTTFICDNCFAPVITVLDNDKHPCTKFNTFAALRFHHEQCQRKPKKASQK